MRVLSFTLHGIVAALVVVTFAGCSNVPNDLGFANHPLDCAIGFGHPDCLPGTAGYNQMVGRQEQAQAIAANDDVQCQSYGAAPGSQAYVQCRMNLDNQRAQMRAAVASQLIGRMGPPPSPQTLNVNVCNVPGQVNTCMYPR